MKQRCVFLKDSNITCVRCNKRNVLCVRKVSHQGERVKPKSTSAVSSKGKQRSSRSLDNSIGLVPISSKNVDLCTKEVPEPVRVEYLSPLTNVAPLQLCNVCRNNHSWVRFPQSACSKFLRRGFKSWTGRLGRSSRVRTNQSGSGRALASSDSNIAGVRKTTYPILSVGK